MGRAAKLTLPFILIFCLGSWAKSSDQDRASQAQRALRFQLSYAVSSQFGTVAEALTAYAAFGIVTETERSNILSFLKQQKVDPNEKLMRPTLQDSTAKWNNTSIALLPNGSLKTSGGRILTFKGSEFADAVFIRVYQAVISNHSSAHHSWSPLPEAHAETQATNAALSASISSVYFQAPWHAKIMCGIVLSLDWPTQKIASILRPEFKVTCSKDGNYEFVDSNPYAEQLNAAYKEHLKYMVNPESEEHKSLAATQALCNLPMWHDKYPYNNQRTESIPRSWTQSYVGDANCTPANAETVATGLKTEAEKARLEIRELMLNHSAPSSAIEQKGQGTTR